MLVLGGLIGYVGLVYLLIVLGGGYLIGHTGSPDVGLSVLATAAVALGFEPVQGRLERFAAGVAHSGSPSPYEILSRFSESVNTGYADDELPARMAKLLAEGTGAETAQVWLMVADRSTLAATWPPAPRGARPEHGTHASRGQRDRPWHSVLVRDGGEILGALRVREHQHHPLTPVEQRLFTGLAAQAALVLRRARLHAELSQRLRELSVRAEELRASRERLIETQDDERRTLERNIHDGAQQNLVALTVNLRLAETLITRSPQRAAQVLADQSEAAQVAIDTLLQLSRGIYPRVLESHGVVAAIRAAAHASSVPVDVVAEEFERPTRAVEAALYFCCLEALQNAAKHSGARRVSIRIGPAQDGLLALTVADDGCGFDTAHGHQGAGLANMRDRIEAAGGLISVDSQPGRGTALEVRMPAAAMLEVGALR